MTSPKDAGWYVIATEAQRREERLRASLGIRAQGKTLERAVADLLEENRLLYRWNLELRNQVRAADAPTPPEPITAPLSLGDDWTRGT